MKQIWDTSRQLAVTSRVDENKAWQQFQQRTGIRKTGKEILAKKHIPWLKIAAAIIFLAGLTLAIRTFTSKTVSANTTIAATNSVIADTLMDGSIITINKRSSITYPEKFSGHNRPVTLTGEAFFNVAPDKTRPFVISVNDIKVTVVGTSFNIKSDSIKAEIIVETGIVKVSRAGVTTTLVAGEKLSLSAASSNIVKEKVTDRLYKYYRGKELVCDDTPLWKMVQVLNEAYSANIVIQRKELENLRLNTTFNNESLDKILEIIHLTFDITITRKDGKIILQ